MGGPYHTLHTRPSEPDLVGTWEADASSQPSPSPAVSLMDALLTIATRGGFRCAWTEVDVHSLAHYLPQHPYHLS